jgi:hypothetical protein
MYAAVRRYEGVTDPAEAGRRVKEGFVPLIREVPGFVAYYWIDAGDGAMVSTSVFEDRTGAEESTKRAANFVRENLASLLPNPPQVTAGEVVASAALSGAASWAALRAPCGLRRRGLDHSLTPTTCPEAALTATWLGVP